LAFCLIVLRVDPNSLGREYFPVYSSNMLASSSDELIQLPDDGSFNTAEEFAAISSDLQFLLNSSTAEEILSAYSAILQLFIAFTRRDGESIHLTWMFDLAVKLFVNTAPYFMKGVSWPGILPSPPGASFPIVDQGRGRSYLISLVWIMANIMFETPPEPVTRRFLQEDMVCAILSLFYVGQDPVCLEALSWMLSNHASILASEQYAYFNYDRELDAYYLLGTRLTKFFVEYFGYFVAWASPNVLRMISYVRGYDSERGRECILAFPRDPNASEEAATAGVGETAVTAATAATAATVTAVATPSTLANSEDVDHDTGSAASGAVLAPTASDSSGHTPVASMSTPSTELPAEFFPGPSAAAAQDLETRNLLLSSVMALTKLGINSPEDGQNVVKVILQLSKFLERYSAVYSPTIRTKVSNELALNFNLCMLLVTDIIPISVLLYAESFTALRTNAMMLMGMLLCNLSRDTLSPLLDVGAFELLKTELEVLTPADARLASGALNPRLVPKMSPALRLAREFATPGGPSNCRMDLQHSLAPEALARCLTTLPRNTRIMGPLDLIDFTTNEHATNMCKQILWALSNLSNDYPELFLDSKLISTLVYYLRSPHFRLLTEAGEVFYHVVYYTARDNLDRLLSLLMPQEILIQGPVPFSDYYDSEDEERARAVAFEQRMRAQASGLPGSNSLNIVAEILNVIGRLFNYIGRGKSQAIKPLKLYIDLAALLVSKSYAIRLVYYDKLMDVLIQCQESRCAELDQYSELLLENMESWAE